MTDLIPHQAATPLPAVNERGTAMIMRAVEQMAGAHQLAQALAGTAFVPQHFRGKADDVAAAIMYGASIGLDPISALRAVYVVSGTPGLYARQMVAIAQAAGHDVWTEASTDDAVTVCGRRKGSEHVERVTWTPQRAQKAGYTTNKKYSTDPQAMLWARAASDVVRRIASDALAGLDTSVEELQVVEAVDVTSRPSSSRQALRAAITAPAPTPAPAPVAEPSEAPGPVEGVTAAQLRRIGAAMTASAITDRALALAFVSEVVGRPVESRNDLTKVEAGMVIDVLDDEVAAAAVYSAALTRAGYVDGGQEAE